MRNPKLSLFEEVNLDAVGGISEDINVHLSAFENEVGGDYSSRLGNTGRYCTLTLECQAICQIIMPGRLN